MTRYLILFSLLTLPTLAQHDDDADPPPSGIVILPAAAQPGATTALTFHGITGSPLALWTSFSAEPSALAQDGTKIHCQLKVPATTPVGIGAVRLLTTAGVGPLQLFMIDDLPNLTRRGKNTTAGTAQAIPSPCAIDGATEPIAADFYRITGKKGQRLSVEAVAQRLGSRLDPVLRLLDAATGRELAYNDDAPGAGSDARFSLTLPADADYIIELHDTSYDGGPDYRYHLRVGDFPIAVAAFPVAAKRGSEARFTLEGPGLGPLDPVKATLPADAPRRSLSFKYPGGISSGFVSIYADALDETAPPKKQLTSQDPFRITIPAAISGRLTKPGSRDYYSFEAKKGDKFTFHARTRLIGSPSDLSIRVQKPDGTTLAQTKPYEAKAADKKGFAPPPPTDDDSLDITTPDDGVYRFYVDDITRTGGPGFVYHIDLERAGPGFTLSIDTDKLETPAKLKVTCIRRNYDGAITLSLPGAEPKLELKNAIIPAGKNEIELEIKASAAAAPALIAVRVIGTAKIGEHEVTSTANSRPVLRKLFPRLPNPPAELDGLIAIGVRPPAAPATTRAAANAP